MSEITRGAIGMPFEMAMESELSRRQFHSIAQALMAERDQLKAENEALRLALESCADELEGQVVQCYHGQPLEDMHPVTRRAYDRDMLCVTEARAAMGKGEQS